MNHEKLIKTLGLERSGYSKPKPPPPLPVVPMKAAKLFIDLNDLLIQGSGDQPFQGTEVYINTPNGPVFVGWVRWSQYCKDRRWLIGF